MKSRPRYTEQNSATRIMRNCNVKLRPAVLDWLNALADRNNTTMSSELRRQLDLAYKYQQAISEAETAPVRFVKDVSR